MARKLGLAREDIVSAAADLADRDGLEAVTLASVAAAFGIQPPSLYAHVAGLDGLRRELALRAASALGEALREAAAAERAGGLAALGRIARAYRRFALAHPGLYSAAQRAVGPGEDDELYDALAAAARPAIDALGEAGIPAAERVHLTRAFRAALHGFVVLEQHGGFGMPISVDASFDRLVELLLAGVRAAKRRRS